MTPADQERAMAGACSICGSPELIANGDPRNPLCARHLPAKLHTVTTMPDGDDLVARCRCGWEASTHRANAGKLTAAARAHHAAICREAEPWAA